jgi:hypothetical protein
LQPVGDQTHIGLRVGAHHRGREGHQVAHVSVAQDRHRAVGEFAQRRIGHVQSDPHHQHALGAIVVHDGGVDGFERQIAFRLGRLVLGLFLIALIGSQGCGRSQDQKGKPERGEAKPHGAS